MDERRIEKKNLKYFIEVGEERIERVRRKFWKC